MTNQYDYAIGSETAPVQSMPSLKLAEIRLELLNTLRKEFGPFFLWRRPKPEWELIPDQGTHEME